MYIKEINIKSFGALTDRVLKLDRGLNVICGANECGKSTVAMFIKFVLYGLSGKGLSGDAVSEKEHYVNWENGLAAGNLIIETKGGEYSVERRIYRTFEGGRNLYREGLRILNLSTGENIKTAKSPGEYFLGFPEKVFMQSAFVKGLDSAKIDGAGLKVALENLFSSGDEEINTKRAIDKLDSARKLLRHKNGTGGKIGELEEERDRLRELLKNSQDASRQIVDLEGTLADVEEKRRAREGEAEELSALCRAYEAVKLGAKVKSIDECENEVRSIEKELATLDPAIGDELLAKLDICRSTVSDTEQDIVKLNAKHDELEGKLAGRDTGEPESVESVLSSSRKLKRFSTFCLSAGITFAAFALVSILLAFIPAFGSAVFGKGSTAWTAVLGAMFIMLCAAAFILFRFFNLSQKKLYDKWEAEDDETLEGAVIAKHDSYKYTCKLTENINRIESITEEAITKHDREIDRGMEYGRRLGVAMSDNVYEVLDAAIAAVKTVADRRHELTVRMEGAKGRLSAIVEDIGEAERGGAAEAAREALESENRDRILAMTKDEYNEILRKRDFTVSAASALKERESALGKELAALNAAGKTPSEIAGRITVVEHEIASLTEKHDALVTALEALEAAGGKMRRDVMPRVAGDAARIMENVTDGKYGDLSSGESFELFVNAGGERRSVEYLSEGTKDASYIAVRTSLVKVMYEAEWPVMIFDECFARIDRERLGVMMGILSSEGMPQSIVFTCRPEEASFAPNVINL